MPKCAGCTSVGCQCAIQVLDSDTINLTMIGTGTEADPWIISGDALSGGGDAFITVAALNTPSDIKAFADIVCDGSNDQVEINAFLAARYTVGSPFTGEVILLPGTFITSAPIVLNDRLIFRGSGQDATIINYTGTDYAVTSQNSAAPVFVRDMTINVVDVGSGGVYLGGYQSQLSGCYIISYDLNIPSVVFDSYQAYATGNIIASYGVALTASSVSQSVFAGNQFFGGVILSAVENSVFSSNYVAASNVGEPVGVRLFNECNRVLVANNVIDQSSKHGIELTNTNYCSIQGNIIKNPGGATPNTYDGIHLDGFTENNTVQNNVIRGGLYRYAIRVNSSDCIDNWITNNRIPAGVSGDISDLGVGTIVAAGNVNF